MARRSKSWCGGSGAAAVLAVAAALIVVFFQNGAPDTPASKLLIGDEEGLSFNVCTGLEEKDQCRAAIVELDEQPTALQFANFMRAGVPFVVRNAKYADTIPTAPIFHPEVPLGADIVPTNDKVIMEWGDLEGLKDTSFYVPQTSCDQDVENSYPAPKFATSILGSKSTCNLWFGKFNAIAAR